MYVVLRKKPKKKQKVELEEITGLLFGSANHVYKIKDCDVRNIIICNKKLAYPICYKQVMTKYNKLLNILPDLLINDADDGGASIRHALNEIERFRQIIKNKYRKYLKRKDLELMGKKLEVFQRIAQEKMYEIQVSFYNTHSKGTSK